MDVSKLVVVVESQGVTATTEALQGKNGNGGLYRAADKVEKKIVSLTQTFDGLSGKMSASLGAAAMASGLAALEARMGSTTAQLNAMIAALETFGGVQHAANRAVDRGSEALQRKHKWGGVMLSTIKAMTTAWATYGSINLAKSTIEEADAMMAMEMRLKNLTGSSTEASAGMEAIARIANTSRTPIKDNAVLFTRLYDAMKPMGKGGKEAAQASEAVALGLKLWGSTGGEAASTMLQLSQAFNKGKLDGQEFNSVAENGKPILKAIAAELGVNISELGKYRSAGKITSEVMYKALAHALPEWQRQMAAMPLSFDDSMTLIKNSWTSAMGEIQKDTGFNTTIATFALILVDVIQNVKGSLSGAFGALGLILENNKGTLGITAQMIVGAITDVISLGKVFFPIIGALLGINQEFSILGAAMMGVRVVLNVIQSVLVTIGGLIFKIVEGGIVLASVFVGIGEVIVKAVLWAVEQVAEKFGMLAEILGMTSISEPLKNIAASIRDVRGGWLDGAKAVYHFSDALGDAAKSAADFNKQNAVWTDAGYAQLTTPEGFNSDGSKPSHDFKDGTGIKPKAAVDDKAAKKAAAAAEAQAKLMTALRATNEQLKTQAAHLNEYGLAYDKLGPSEKQVISLEQQLVTLRASGKPDAKKIGYVEEQLALAKLNAELERQNTLTQDRLKAYKAEEDKERGALKKLQEEAESLKRKLDTYEEPKGSADLAKASELQKKLDLLRASPEYGMDKQALANKSVMLVLYEQEIQELTTIAKLKEQLASKDAGKEFDKLLDPKKAEKFGDALAEGFGATAKAMGKMVNVFQQIETRMSKVQKLKDLAAQSGDASRMAKASRAEVEAQIRSYADLAGAAKGFFSEGSRGYQVMEAAEKTFRAFQMAMQVEAFIRESGLMTTLTRLFVANEAKKTAAQGASLGPHLAVEEAKQGANATTALTSALAAPFPTNLAAYAMVGAMLAAIGVAVGGGGGGSVDTSAQRQKEQGTGTVFGDEGKKSESIAKSIEALSSNSDIALSYSSAMLSSLQNIEASLTGVTNAVVRQRGQVTGSDFNAEGGVGIFDTLLAPLGAIGIPTVVGSVLEKLGFGTSVDLQDSGLTAGNRKLSDILANGVDVRSYQDIKETKKAFGISYSSSSRRDTQDAGDEIDKQFEAIFGSMADIISQSAPVLGVAMEEALAKIGEVQIDMSSISLKGLSSQEIQDQLSAVFSGYGDRIADAAFGSIIEPFRKAGEGGLETATRLASGIDSANYALEKLGVAAINFTAITNKTGDVAAEIVRDSILVVEAGTGVGAIISTLSGTATELADMYASLVDVRTSLSTLKIADDVTASLIRAAGGLDALKDSLSTYTDAFYSDAEKQAMQVASLQGEFRKIGVSVPASREAFRTLVQSLAATGEAGQQLALQVVGLAGAYDEVLQVIEQNIADKQSALIDAYNTQSSSMQEVIDKFSDLALSMRDFRESLLVDNISTLSGVDKYNTLKEQMASTYSKAMGGDADSYARYQQLAKAFLDASKEVYSSSAGYSQDFAFVIKQTSDLEASAVQKVDTTQQSLDLLTRQVDTLVSIETATVSVEQAIRDLQAAMAAGGMLDGSHAGGLSYVPWDGYRAELHKGEAVLTASEAAQWRSSLVSATTLPGPSIEPPTAAKEGADGDRAELVRLREAVAVLTATVEAGLGRVVSAQAQGTAALVGAVEAASEDAARNTYHKAQQNSLV